ncbi:hypothetical protein [Ferrovibrio sp.]|uniref:hypothetical protein n=1 Tax=Ferrovibrio sp. TaxID=1917215 RepID=UPI00311EF7D1
MIAPTRRRLIGGIGLLFAAPAIVKVSSLMPVKVVEEASEPLVMTAIDHSYGDDRTVMVTYLRRGRLFEVVAVQDISVVRPVPQDFSLLVG